MLLDGQVVRPAAPEVVRTHALVVRISAFLSGTGSGLPDPVLNSALRHVDERLVPRGLLGLDVAVDGRLDVDREPRLALLPVDELAGSVLSPTTSSS